ncbi:MAG: SHOCT domain-containing protein [Gammaproteobacteria bacterium]|nr:SHOCT domain-containing protein [Gammaproteobacteria bacterium]
MYMSDMGIGMWIFWILVIVGVALIAKLLIVGSSNQSSMISASPLEILKKRYASGEINQEEFESMKKELEK